MTRPCVRPDPRHVPVLVDEVVAALAIAPGETLVDGTFGAAATRAPCSRRGRDE